MNTPMMQTPLLDQQRRLIRSLLAEFASRAEREETIEREHREAVQRLDREERACLDQLEQEYEKATRDASSEQRRTRRDIEQRFTQLRQELSNWVKSERGAIEEKAAHSEQEARRLLQEAVWTAETVYEGKERQPEEHYEQTVELLRQQLDRVGESIASARRTLRGYRMGGLLRDDPGVADGASTPPPSRKPMAASELSEESATPGVSIDRAVKRAETEAVHLRQLGLPKMFRGVVPVILLLFVAAVPFAYVFWRSEWQFDQTVIMYTAGGAAVGIAMLVGLYMLAVRPARVHVAKLKKAVAEVHALHDVALAAAARQRDKLEDELLETRDREVRDAKTRYAPIIEKIKERRKHHKQRILRTEREKTAEFKSNEQRDLVEIEEIFQQRTLTARTAREEGKRECAERLQAQRTEVKQKHETAWNALVSEWTGSITAAQQSIGTLQAHDAALFPAWNDIDWNEWSPPQTDLAAARFGRLTFEPAQLAGGLPKDDRLTMPLAARFTLPALLELPDHASLLIETDAEGRDTALDMIRALMLRLLTVVPPGKARFTIIDPVSLGQSFAAFMHLSDYEAQLVGERIWTDPQHIEQRLVDLTEHMENVIQKYLRNEFESIAQYNEQAGEIAEPYRFLVIADFPSNFTDEAARRLASIVASGPRCGVYTLVHHDLRADLPKIIDWQALAKNSSHLRLEKGTITWHDDDFNRFPLALDAAPTEAHVSQIMHAVGRHAQDSTRVEVPFEAVAPPAEKRWSENSADRIRVPLGRCGATKLQMLELGRGTKQHALIAGKTGSGKSTLLHVLITNLALWYSPDEIEMYLVDFKKGVEFKTYVTHELPHARVIAIESDREFGLSVLQKLDAELRRRGTIYRDLNVQDMAGYRAKMVERNTMVERLSEPRSASRSDAATTLEPLPRLLLIIDEFQEFFVEDDKIGQDASLLLDRLVRQGRAFGIHVLLGSQTLGGAYTLARTTLGQMGIRIALQCSESDSYMILNEENAAARLLSRPGEAIYNDASGMLEGNSPFQIVWLPDPVREKALSKVREEWSVHHKEPPPRPIVFEGNVPADITRNTALTTLMRNGALSEVALAPEVWLGEPIAIKEPTSVRFRRQSGSNLLMIGQRDESALALFAVMLLSLGAQLSPTNAQLLILDGTPPDAPHAGTLANIATVLPQRVENVDYPDVEDIILMLGQEVTKRVEARTGDAPAIFLSIFGLQRYRMLRQSDDFGFSSSFSDDSGTAPKPKVDRVFTDILRDGPAVGVHTLLWCDTLNNLNRALDRNTLREFELRILFQMSNTDSTMLIDSPEASKLGLRRALLANEEQGLHEKFRPYALPGDDWLDEARKAFAKLPCFPPGLRGQGER